jgi:hypothetical protein
MFREKGGYNPDERDGEGKESAILAVYDSWHGN